MNLVTGAMSGLGHGFYSYGFSALFKPISSELGFTRAATSVSAGIGRVEGGLLAPLTGWLVDRFGPRWVTIVGLCFMAAGLAMMNFVNSLWSYYVVWGLMVGAGSNLALTIAADKALTNWFVRKRGMVFGIRFVLIGIGGVIVLPLITWLITTSGWRTTCLMWSGVVLAFVPLAWLFVKQKRPEYYGLLPDGVEVEPGSAVSTDDMIDKGVEYAASLDENEFTLRQSLRTSSFWMLAVARTFVMTVSAGINIHCIPFLTDMGIDPTVAGGMMAMMVFFTIPSRFLGGFLADRFDKDRLKFLLAATHLLPAIGIAAFLLNPGIATVYVLLILFGLGSGAFTPLDIVIKGRFFGRKAYGSIQGASLMLASPVSLLSAVYTGWVYDTTGSYATAFTVFVAIGLLGTVLMCLLHSPKPPARVTDIHQFM